MARKTRDDYELYTYSPQTDPLPAKRERMIVRRDELKTQRHARDAASHADFIDARSE